MKYIKNLKYFKNYNNFKKVKPNYKFKNSKYNYSYGYFLRQNPNATRKDRLNAIKLFLDNTR